MRVERQRRRSGRRGSIILAAASLPPRQAHLGKRLQLQIARKPQIKQWGDFLAYSRVPLAVWSPLCPLPRKQSRSAPLQKTSKVHLLEPLRGHGGPFGFQHGPVVRVPSSVSHRRSFREGVGCRAEPPSQPHLPRTGLPASGSGCPTRAGSRSPGPDWRPRN